jgi:hypothetical protein
METTATAARKAAPSKPVKSFRLSGLSVGVFANSAEHQGRPVTYYKVSVQKVYRNGDGFKTTTTLDADDLPVACFLLLKAYDFIAGQRVEEVERTSD